MAVASLDDDEFERFKKMILQKAKNDAERLELEKAEMLKRQAMTKDTRKRQLLLQQTIT